MVHQMPIQSGQFLPYYLSQKQILRKKVLFLDGKTFILKGLIYQNVTDIFQID